MKTILLTLAYTIGIGELILAGYFWVTNSKNEIRRVMALISLFTGAWVITSALSAYVNPTPFVIFILSLVYVFGIFLIVALLHLAIIFPYSLFHFDRVHKALLYVPAVIFSSIALFTKTIVTGIDISPETPGLVISGPLHDMYNYYILLYLIFTFSLLLYKAKHSDGTNRKMAFTVFVSIFLGGMFPIWFDILVPSFFPQFTRMNYLFGNIGTVLWLGVTTYVVRKK